MKDATWVAKEVRCNGCKKTPEQLSEYVKYAEQEGITVQEAVEEDGTYNPRNGHFLCTRCYIEAGMPSGPQGWHAP